MSEFRETLERLSESLPVAEAPQWREMVAAKTRRQVRVRAGFAAMAVLGLSVGYWAWNGKTAERRRVEDAELLQQVNEGLARPVPRALGPLMGMGMTAN